MAVRLLPEPREESHLLNGSVVVLHVGAKGLELGGFIAPLVLLPRIIRQRGLPGISASLKSAGRTALVATAIVEALGGVRMLQSSWEQNYDRAYRIWWNESQNRADKFAAGGAAGAALGGLALSVPLGVPGTVGLFAIGASLGTIGHILTMKGTAKPTAKSL